ncbi:MAG: hypothetical protein DME97_02315 [Verrucomicrobia bacterium]|nr:MAG: hypothetical protein DME97_02315 [Verrucomicrobiota bacterium]
MLPSSRAILNPPSSILYPPSSRLYGVTTKRLNEQVKRNRERFPDDFMFQLTAKESAALGSQFATLKRGQNIKYRPYAFTEQKEE